MKHSVRCRIGAALTALPLAIACAALVVQDGGITSAVAAPAAMKPAVTITNYSFRPATLTVRKGATVIWLNTDEDVHTIKSTAGPGAFSSPALDSGGKFQFTFAEAGTYHYICTVHPYMHGVIVVR